MKARFVKDKFRFPQIFEQMSVITPFDPWKGRLCTCPKKYSLSPYTGCPHACRYCYITSYIPDAFHCRVKKDYFRRLRKDLERTDRSLPISIANSSDPYPLIEKDLMLMRDTLSILIPRGFKVLIITKSNLVTRDADLIKKGNCSVSLSITTLDEVLCKSLEPNAPPPSLRLKALKALAKEGIPCSVRIDPIIPGINDDGLESLVKAVAEAKVSHVVASTYKAKPDNLHRVISAFPALKERLTSLYSEGEQIGRARYLRRELREDLLRRLKIIVEEFGMTYATCREGFSQLISGKTCDGSHLIPTRIG